MPCQRSSPEAALIRHFVSCQRKQRGEKQQKVAPCSGSGKRVTAEQKTAPRHVFPPFSTQQHKLQLRSSPWHCSEDQARSSPRPRCIRNTPRAGRDPTGARLSSGGLADPPHFRLLIPAALISLKDKPSWGAPGRLSEQQTRLRGYRLGLE